MIGVVSVITHNLRPDERITQTFMLDSDDWKPVYERQMLLLAYVTLHNVSSQDVKFATQEGEPSGENFDTLGPNGIVSMPLNPKRIWLQRSASTSKPKVALTYAFWTINYVDEMNALYGSITMDLKTGGRRG